MSDNNCSAISKSGMVENVGVPVAREISFVVVMHAQVGLRIGYCIYADFKVFLVFRPP